MDQSSCKASLQCLGEQAALAHAELQHSLGKGKQPGPCSSPCCLPSLCTAPSTQQALRGVSLCSFLSSTLRSVLALRSLPFNEGPLQAVFDPEVPSVWQHLEWRTENLWVWKQLHVSRDSQAGPRSCIE